MNSDDITPVVNPVTPLTSQKTHVFNHVLLEARAAPEDTVPETITNDSAHSTDMVDVLSFSDKIDRTVGYDGTIASSNSICEATHSRPKSLEFPPITNTNGGATASNEARDVRIFSKGYDSDGELLINNLEGDIEKMEKCNRIGIRDDEDNESGNATEGVVDRFVFIDNDDIQKTLNSYRCYCKHLQLHGLKPMSHYESQVKIAHV